jgi:hypothetical protein
LNRFIPEVKEVLSKEVLPGEYRKPNNNHLLMRPVGQRAFAGAVGVLAAGGVSIREAVKSLSAIDLWIHKKAWHQILWDFWVLNG